MINRNIIISGGITSLMRDTSSSFSSQFFEFIPALTWPFELILFYPGSGTAGLDG